MIIQSKMVALEKTINLPKEMVVQGTIPVAYKKDVFEAEGKIRTHPIYGRFIELVGSAKVILPQIESALIDFIRRRVKGVGPKKAQVIIQHLGLDAISKIYNDENALLSCGFKGKEATRIREELISHITFEELVHFLQSIQMEVDIALDVYKELKDVSVAKIRSNPYTIANAGKATWLHADRIAKKLSFVPHFTERYRHAVLYYIDLKVESEGNLCIKRDTLIHDFVSGEFLKKHGSFPENPTVPKDKMIGIVKDLMESGALVGQINQAGELLLYRPGYYHIEESIIQGLDNLVNRHNGIFCDRGEIDAFIHQYEQKYFPLAKEQQDAIYMALNNKLSILTGGPGTGKTHTTNAVLQCIRSVNPKASISLMAPTGKAAKRLSEMTGSKAKTIHRGLGIKGFGAEEELTQINSDFLVIDEFSMTDAYLFYVLLQQIGENTRLVLVGDYHQLPSVGPGLILRDLIHSNRIPTTELTQIFRQSSASQIVVNAHKMQRGLTTHAPNGLTFDSQRGDSYFVKRTEPLRIQEDVIETVRRFRDKGFKLDDILVLAPIHRGLLGTEELNRQIQRAFNPPTSLVEIEKENGECFRVGDRVIQTENNYDLEVFNGEIGTVSDIYFTRSEGTEHLVLAVEFPDRDDPVEFKERDYEVLQLAYCISIHKSQGSESPIVIMPIHETYGNILDRTLLYTGYTRTKETHIYLGEEETLNQAILRINGSERLSMIREKIQAVL